MFKIIKNGTILHHQTSTTEFKPFKAHETPSILLNFLYSGGHRVSLTKVQLSTSQVTYLGFASTPTHKTIFLDRKQFNHSTTREETLSVLGMASCLCSWVSSFPLPTLPYMRQCFALHRNPLLHPLSSHSTSFSRPFSRPQSYIFWT